MKPKALAISACLVALLGGVWFFTFSRVTDYVQVTGSTGCNPVPIPDENCPEALSWEEMMQVRGVLDMCAPRKWYRNENVTDQGYDFYAKAADIDEEAMNCLKQYLSNKVRIDRTKR